VRREDAEDVELLREIGELLEGTLEVNVLGVTVDLGVELGREEVPLDHV